MTRDDARATWAKSGLSYSILNRENLGRLRKLMEIELKDAGLMNDTLRMDNSVKPIYAKRNWAGLRCRAYYFEDREAVTFNSDGFVGFCGWADNDHVAPFVTGFVKWVEEMVANKEATTPAKAA